MGRLGWTQRFLQHFNLRSGIPFVTTLKGGPEERASIYEFKRNAHKSRQRQQMELRPSSAIQRQGPRLRRERQGQRRKFPPAKVFAWKRQCWHEHPEQSHDSKKK